jgi:hypothetical protein
MTATASDLVSLAVLAAGTASAAASG